MLEKIDLTKKLEKQSYREKMEALELELGRLQRECHAYKVLDQDTGKWKDCDLRYELVPESTCGSFFGKHREGGTGRFLCGNLFF